MPRMCNNCNGRGYNQNTTEESCSRCRGEGRIGNVKCGLCGGNGRLKSRKLVPCQTCRGTGMIDTYW